MARFPWQVLPGIQPPIPTGFLYLQADGQLQTAVAGVLDSGASITSLRAPIEQPRLGVLDETCIPTSFISADGAISWQKLTMLTAHLDGHDFRIPVGLSDDLPINLIGRVGLFDLWEIRTDVNNASTVVDWIGPQPAWGSRPWGDAWQDYWKQMIDAGYTWPNWNRNGRPGIPPPPAVPSVLPPLGP